MHPIENIMQTSMDRINRLVDVNTVIGDAVDTGCGTVLLPVSKVSLGFTVGGGEYDMKTGCRRDGAEGSKYPFAGLSAVGMSLKPLAFVSVEQGSVRVLPASVTCAADRLADIVPQVLKSIDRLVNAVVDNMTKKCENNGDIGACAPCDAQDAPSGETD